MRTRNVLLWFPLALATLTGCVGGSDRAEIPEPLEWEAGGASSSIMQVVSAEDTIVALGAFVNGLEIQGHSISGSRLFAAWVRADGVVERLDRIANDADPSPDQLLVNSIEGALLTPDRLWVAIDFRDELEIVGANAPPTILTAAGAAMAIVAFERSGAVRSSVVAQGDFQRWATRLSSRGAAFCSAVRARRSRAIRPRPDRLVRAS